MKPEIDESLLTAYALGELDAAEGARVAARLDGDGDARRYVEQVRQTAGVVAEGLSRESSDGLGLIHREVIERRLREVSRAARQPQQPRPAALRMRNWIPLAASIAASVAIVCGTLAYLLPRLYPPPTASVPATTESNDNGGGLAVLGREEEILQPALPGEDELAFGETTGPEDSTDEFAAREPFGGEDPDWEPVEKMIDPRVFEAEQAARRAEEPAAPRTPPAGVEPGPGPTPGPTKVARGPAQSPEAEDVRPGGDKPAVSPPKSDKPKGGGRRGVFVSPPRDPQVFEKIVKSAADTQPRVFENPFRLAAQRPRSSFPVRVETGSSYRAVRAALLERELPPAHRVRIEELINRFAYHYPAPAEDGLPLAVSVEVATCPWDAGHRLARVAVKAREGGATVVARGVEVSLKFNPLASGAWRLIGYENAPARGQSVPAFDLTAGDTATALYEIIPAAGAEPRIGAAAAPKDLFTVSLSFRDPQDGAAQELDVIASDPGNGFDRASEDFRFTAAVAAFGMLLRDSQFKGTATHADVIRWATSGKGADFTGERAAFIQLAKAALDLTR